MELYDNYVRFANIELFLYEFISLAWSKVEKLQLVLAFFDLAVFDFWKTAFIILSDSVLVLWLHFVNAVDVVQDISHEKDKSATIRYFAFQKSSILSLP